MKKNIITCPKCQTEIEITEALESQLRNSIEKKYSEEFALKETQLQITLKQIDDQKNEIQKQKETLENEIKERTSKEIEKLKANATKEAQEKISLEYIDLKQQLQEKTTKLEETQKTELELRKQQRDLEEKTKNFELEMQRKLDEERQKIQSQAEQQANEQGRFKLMEKDKQIENMLKQIDELKRKGEQGSQKLQGEVLELDFEECLRSHFSIDNIAPVPSGKRGADIIQIVHNSFGGNCGTILWEIKQTKNWSDSWIDKLKEDQRELKAEIAVIMTNALPAGINNFGIYNGIWVTDYQSAIGLTLALRLQLIKTANALTISEGKEDKKELLYNYLTGTEFKQRVEAIAEPFIAMQDDLAKEKRAITGQWQKREKNLEKVILNLEGMYGDLQGLAGSAMPKIDSLDISLLEE